MWFREQSEPAGRPRANRRARVSRDPILAVSARTPAQSKARVRRVSAIAVLLVALAGCVAAAYFGGQWVSDQLFAYNPLFTVHNLDIRTDGAVSSARIRERYNLRPGMNLFAVNLRTLHADLMKIPEVRAVDIQRQLPGTLRLRIGERVALARLAEDRPGARLAVDREGRVLGQSSWLAALPLITGWPKAGLQPGRRITERQMVDALTVLDLCVAPHRNVIRIQSLDVSNAEYVELHMAARVKRVWLGRSRLEARLDRLADILQELAKLGRTLEFLDLTMDRNIPGLVAPPAGMETL